MSARDPASITYSEAQMIRAVDVELCWCSAADARTLTKRSTASWSTYKWCAQLRGVEAVCAVHPRDVSIDFPAVWYALRANEELREAFSTVADTDEDRMVEGQRSLRVSERAAYHWLLAFFPR